MEIPVYDVVCFSFLLSESPGLDKGQRLENWKNFEIVYMEVTMTTTPGLTVKLPDSHFL